ncbi:MAG: hypothetical protein V4494_03145 [Chlamydiota bacterium]
MSKTLLYAVHFLLVLTGAYCFAEESDVQIEYLEPIDGAKVSCPLVELRGKIFQYTFPGIPNFQSLEEGDAPEMRWILEISESEIQRLIASGCLPQEDIFDAEARGWVQLVTSCSDNELILFSNRQVIVEGVLGSLVFHIHAPIAIETRGIYDDE